jgi:hypothetical protein
MLFETSANNNKKEKEIKERRKGKRLRSTGGRRMGLKRCTGQDDYEADGREV